MPVSNKYIETMNNALSSQIPQTQWVQFSKAINCITSQQSIVLLLLSFQGQVFKDVLSREEAGFWVISLMIVNGIPSTIFI